MVLLPPTSVPGPYVAPGPPPGKKPHPLPQERWIEVMEDVALGNLATEFYGNPKEAVRILNANLDRLRSLNEPVRAGTRIRVP